MRAEYKRDLQSNYLILSGEEEKGEEDYRIQMAERNKISGLLPFYRSRTDGEPHLHYEITGKQPLPGLYEKKPLSRSDILMILTGINEIVDNLQKFLLSPEQLVFLPEYIFMDPNDRRIRLCYAPGIKSIGGISVLAEFILKRLDHQDREAVALGYLFYQKTQEENFSLQEALREILRRSAEQKTGETQDEQEKRKDYNESFRRGAGLSGEDQYSKNEGRKINFYDGQSEEIPGERKERKLSGREFSGGEEGVIHKPRRKQRGMEQEAGKKKERFVDRLFEKIHPAVLLSTLFLMAALEIVFYLGYLRLTETGGAFFLILSVAMLANSRWRKHREEKEAGRFAGWSGEEQEESREFSELKEEMYEFPGKGQYVDETRCLTELSSETGIRLVLSCTSGGFTPGQEPVREIKIGPGGVVVGKLEGQCDVLMQSSTVSRMHARLECREEKYFIKDLNSRNGTFLNGERLEPQERREFFTGDRICFANIEYRVCR